MKYIVKFEGGKENWVYLRAEQGEHAYQTLLSGFVGAKGYEDWDGNLVAINFNRVLSIVKF